ncbi:MAG TPA: alpha/beta hydrolase [Vicinamibacteria bacterium]
MPVKPFYFGRSSRPLYGVLHEARGARRGPGVVLCPPFGQEALRAHRSLRELASRLAEAGRPALRFDYGGSGDSAGEPEDARLDGWVEDALAAVEEMKEATGEEQVALLGLRLGASVALIAARRAGGVEALVLWEPVVDGVRHLAELRAAHAAWMHDHAPLASLRPDEVLGFPLPRALADDLALLQLDGPGPLPAGRTLVVAGEDGGRPLPWAGAPGVEAREVPPAPVWLHAEGMSRALVPGTLLEGIVRWLAEGGE